jgi:hypothetical protein
MPRHGLPLSVIFGMLFDAVRNWNAGVILVCEAPVVAVAYCTLTFTALTEEMVKPQTKIAPVGLAMTKVVMPLVAVVYGSVVTCNLIAEILRPRRGCSQRERKGQYEGLRPHAAFFFPVRSSPRATRAFAKTFSARSTMSSDWASLTAAWSCLPCARRSPAVIAALVCASFASATWTELFMA